MTPAELNSLRDRMADEYYAKCDDDDYSIDPAFKAGFDAAIEIGKTLGHIEIYDKIKELCEYKANNGMTSLSAPAFIVLAEHCAGWARASARNWNY
jgi:hypothetical protein